MVRNLLALFMVLVFAVASFAEVVEPTSVDLHSTTVESSQVVVGDLACPDCTGDDCSTTSDCCINLCSCPTPTNINSSLYNFRSKVISKNRPSWDYSHRYIPPFLDSALKPPLFS
ncbi:hypothetical protein A9Q84_14910 [Halobacteriovorax marinus]|uniref:Secreted protein n=1 Tax=Halobacteriovorax marinus TaxID=97084 RepID=A0A1Y5F5L8_9BACT|nr:hypothetical protein A9Q84_14910 [Halobacteriovorax marinus]